MNIQDIKYNYATLAGTSVSNVSLYWNLGLATAAAENGERIRSVVLGESGHFIVTSPAAAVALVKAGYQYA